MPEHPANVGGRWMAHGEAGGSTIGYAWTAGRIGGDHHVLSLR